MKKLIQQTLGVVGVAFVLVTPAAYAAPGKTKPRIAATPSETQRQPAGNNRFNPATGTTDGKETGVLTGTHLRKTYTVRGHMTDAAQPVYILDRRDPRFTSHATVGGILSTVPFGFRRH